MSAAKALASTYEEGLVKMLGEREARLRELKDRLGKVGRLERRRTTKEIDRLEGEIIHIRDELDSYTRGMSNFRVRPPRGARAH